MANALNPKKIVVSVNNRKNGGGIKVDAVNYNGKGCVAAVQQVIAAMGGKGDGGTPKPEMFTEPVEERVKVTE